MLFLFLKRAIVLVKESNDSKAALIANVDGNIIEAVLNGASMEFRFLGCAQDWEKSRQYDGKGGWKQFHGRSSIRSYWSLMVYGKR